MSLLVDLRLSKKGWLWLLFAFLILLCRVLAKYVHIMILIIGLKVNHAHHRV